MPASELLIQISPAATCHLRPVAFYFLCPIFPAIGGEMTWRFEVVATVQERLLSRILQVLEVQRVSIRSFKGEMVGTGAIVTFTVFSEENKAYRIEALLYRLEGIEDVSVLKDIESR
jgi:hypothetical protein